MAAVYVESRGCDAYDKYMEKVKVLLKKYYMSFLLGIVGAVVAEFVYYASPSGSYYTNPIGTLMREFTFHQNMLSNLVLDLSFFYVPFLLIYCIVTMARKRMSTINLKDKLSSLFLSTLSFSFGVVVGEFIFGIIFVTTIHFGF